MKIYLFPWGKQILLVKTAVGMLAFLICTGLVNADSYLDALNEEVSKPEYVKEAEQEIKRISQQQPDTSAELKRDVSSAVVDVARFENLLHSKYPATYQVYLKLNKSAQSDVYRIFQDTRELTGTTKRILEIYLH